MATPEEFIEFCRERLEGYTVAEAGRIPRSVTQDFCGECVQAEIGRERARGRAGETMTIKQFALWVGLISSFLGIATASFAVIRFFQGRLNSNKSLLSALVSRGVVMPGILTVLAVMLLIAMRYISGTKGPDLTPIPNALATTTTAEPTKTATPVSTIPTPTQSCLRSSILSDYQINFPYLGCLVSQPPPSYIAYQRFQSGILLWIKEKGVIYGLFYNNKKWAYPPPSPPVPPCQEASQYGDNAPVSGFSQVWCYSWRLVLGAPLEKDQSNNSVRFEEFANGLVIQESSLGITILYYSDNT